MSNYVFNVRECVTRQFVLATGPKCLYRSLANNNAMQGSSLIAYVIVQCRRSVYV